MERKYLRDLEEWMLNPNKKPLLIYGARQVGKTYLIRDIFANKYYKNNFLYFDLKVDKKISKYIENHIGPKDIIRFIESEYNKKIDKTTLLIFDEAQDCLPIITAMKYFCQDARDIPVIVTGSMVRIKLQRDLRKPGPKNKNNFLFPIGCIDMLNMYPLNFDEFLKNSNQILYEHICKSYKEKLPLEREFHKLALDYFYTYLMIGGMPEAINEYLTTKDILSTRKIIYKIYDNYLGDMGLYQTSTESTLRTNAIYKSIYSQLNKEQKNFKCSLINKKLKNRDLNGPIDWLNLANIVYKSSQLKEKVTIPLFSNNESLYRLYLSDMGIFTYQSNEKLSTFIDSDAQNTLSGIFFENYVAIELVNAGLPLFYWRGKARCELEFLVNSYKDLIAIDVKKSKGSMSSIEEFRHHNMRRLCIKVSSNNYGYNKENNILTIPFYMFFLVAKDISENKKII